MGAEDVGAASLNAANDLISVFGDTPLSTFLAKYVHDAAVNSECLTASYSAHSCCECVARMPSLCKAAVNAFEYCMHNLLHNGTDRALRLSANVPLNCRVLHIASIHTGCMCCRH